MGFSEDPTNIKCFTRIDILKILFSILYGKQNILQNCNWVRVDKLHLNKEHLIKRSQSRISYLLNIFAKWFVKSFSLIKSLSKLNFMGGCFYLQGQLKGQSLLTLHIIPKQQSCLPLLLWQYDRLAVDWHFQKRWTMPKIKIPYTHSKFGFSSNLNSKNHPFFLS